MPTTSRWTCTCRQRWAQELPTEGVRTCQGVFADQGCTACRDALRRHPVYARGGATCEECSRLGQADDFVTCVVCGVELPLRCVLRRWHLCRRSLYTMPCRSTCRGHSSHRRLRIERRHMFIIRREQAHILVHGVHRCKMGGAVSFCDRLLGRSWVTRHVGRGFVRF